MPNSYRVYRLDRAKHVLDVEWISASTDTDAIAIARAMGGSGRREVWQGERLVAVIEVAPVDEPSAAFWL